MSAYSPNTRATGRSGSGSSALTPAELHTRTSNGDFAPAYYFFGAEDYRVVEAEKFLARQFIGPEQSDLSIRRMSLRGNSLGAILDELQALPLLGGKRVISIAEAQSMRPDQFEQLAAVFQYPDPTRLVILTSPSVRLPKYDSAFIKNIGRIAISVEFKPQTASEAAAQVDRKMAQYQLSFAPGGRDHFLALVGVRKSAIDQEVEKLRQFSDGTPITADQVKRLTSDWTDSAASLLAQAILQRDRVQSLHFLQLCMSEGTSSSTLIWQLGNYLTDLLLRSYGQKPSWHFDSRLVEARRQDAGRFRPAEIEAAIVAVAKAEHQLRHSAISDEFVMEAMVATLIPENATAKPAGKFSAR